MFSMNYIVRAIILLSIVIVVSSDTKQLRSVQKRKVMPECKLTPETEEGPYYCNGPLVRENTIESEEGIPFTLALTVINTNNCTAIINAAIDLWHCNSIGDYSHFDTSRMSKTTYLGGIQLTNSTGQAVFNTIYPGYYDGRATHVHVKVRFGGKETSSASIHYWDGHTSHTGQIFFNDSYKTLVQEVKPYSLNTAQRTLNSDDRVYTPQDGVHSMVTLAYVDPAKDVRGGITGTILPRVDSTVDVSSSGNANTITEKQREQGVSHSARDAIVDYA